MIDKWTGFVRTSLLIAFLLPYFSFFFSFVFHFNSIRDTAVGRVALDTRLGCVSKEGNEESKRIIDAINTFFWTVAEVELRMPIWRFYETKAYRKYIGALDSFTEYVASWHFHRAWTQSFMSKVELNRTDHLLLFTKFSGSAWSTSTSLWKIWKIIRQLKMKKPYR